MKKIKIYLETSAISNLEQLDLSEQMSDMRVLWELLKHEKYDVVVSSITHKELESTKDTEKRDLLFDYLDSIDYEFIERNSEIEAIADDIISKGILTKNSYSDCLHIACALITNCDCIVSYNFRHLVNIRTIKGVQAISMMQGYVNLNIVPAKALITEGDEQ